MPSTHFANVLPPSWQAVLDQVGATLAVYAAQAEERARAVAELWESAAQQEQVLPAILDSERLDGLAAIVQVVQQRSQEAEAEAAQTAESWTTWQERLTQVRQQTATTCVTSSVR